MIKYLLGGFATLSTLTLTSQGAVSLLAHYTFDNDTTTAAVGSNATAGSSASHTTATGEWIKGGGALKLNGNEELAAGTSGVVGGDSFNWVSDQRVVAFWVKATTQSSLQPPTIISLGSGGGNGARFDLNLQGTSDSNLRLEIQGSGSNTDYNMLTNNWMHVTVVVKSDGATGTNTDYYIHDESANLLTSGNFTGANAINTAAGPLRIGDSFQGGEREFEGLIDDVRLYGDDGNGAFSFTQTDAQALAAVPEPSSTLLLGLGGISLLLRRRK